MLPNRALLLLPMPWDESGLPVKYWSAKAGRWLEVVQPVRYRNSTNTTWLPAR